VQLHSFIIKLSAAFLGKNAYDKIITRSQNERQQSVKAASTIFALAFWIISPQGNADNPQWTYQQPSLPKMLVMISRLPPKIEHPRSINILCGGSKHYTAINYIVLFLNGVLCGQSLQSVLVYNFTTMLAKSYRSDFFPSSSTVNIYEPGVCFTVMLLSAVSQVGLPRFPIPIAMSDLQSLNSSLLKVIISSKNEPVFICDLRDFPLQIIIDALWTSMNRGSKQPITLNNSRHAPLWWFYLHCGIEETGSPGIICIIYHQVLRHRSNHATSSFRTHLLANAHIAMLNDITESVVTELTSSTVDETALTILKRQRSWGIIIVSSQRKIIFDIQVNPFWPKWQTKCSKLAAKEFETSKFHQDICNRYLMLGFVSSPIPCNAKSTLELQMTYEALSDDLVLPSALTLSNICRREYAPTLDAIKNQSPSRKKVSLALDWWTSTNKLAITLVIAY